MSTTKEDGGIKREGEGGRRRHLSRQRLDLSASFKIC